MLWSPPFTVLSLNLSFLQLLHGLTITSRAYGEDRVNTREAFRAVLDRLKALKQCSPLLLVRV